MNTTFEENAFGDRFLRALDGNAFDSRSARAVFERHFDLDFTEPDQLFVIVGSDSGLLLDYFDSLKLGRATQVLLVEPDEIADLIATERKHREAAAKVHDEHQSGVRIEIDADEKPDVAVRLLRESEWLVTLRSQSLAGYVYSGKLVMLTSIASKLGFDERYEALTLDVRRAMAESSHRVQTQVNSRTFIERHLQNAAFNSDSAALLRGVGAGQTAVILGGGPSLDQDLPWIVANRDRLTIIAVSRLCEKLDRIGLRPDIVVSVDPQQGMYEISKAGIRWEDTLLVNQYHVVPALLQQWRGPTLRLGPPLPWPSALDGKLTQVAGPGPTVSHAATWMAYEFGFRQILLAGVDLCFSASGGTHTSDTPEARLATPSLVADQTVTTYSGRTAITNLGLKNSLDNLAMLARKITDAEVSLINLSANAARIDRIEQRDTASIVLPVGKADISGLTVPGATPETCRLLRRELHTATRSLVMIGKCCRKASRYINRLHGLDGKTADFRYKAKIDHLETSLEKSFGPILKLIKYYAGPELTALCNPSGFDDMDDQAMADWGKNYYRILGETARILRTNLADATEAVGFREMEDELQPDVNALLAFWQRIGTTGRAWHVLQRHETTLDATSRDTLTAALQRFDDTLDDAESDYSSSLAKVSNDTHSVIQQLNSLLNSRNEVALQGLADHLLTRSGPAATLAALAQGFLAELQNEPATAITLFDTVIDTLALQLEAEGELDDDYSPMLEPALLHTAHAHLLTGNPIAAIESLGVLTQHKIAHAPKYAGLLRSQGFVEQAIETLNIYLDAAPEDWRVREDLSQMYLLLGNKSAADAQMESADLTRMGQSLPRAA